MSRSQHVDAADDVRPACPISRQCPDRDYRSRPASVVSATFDPCRNAECFPDREPEPDESVVVAHGRGSDSMHAPGEP